MNLGEDDYKSHGDMAKMIKQGSAFAMKNDQQAVSTEYQQAIYYLENTDNLHMNHTNKNYDA